MKTIPFDPHLELILVDAVLEGRGGRSTELSMVVDTGSSMTVIRPDILDRVGYNPREGETTTMIRTPLGQEPGYTIRVAGLEVLGYRMEDVRVHAHELSDTLDVIGLIGLDLLRQFNCEFRFREGQIRVTPAPAPPLFEP